MTGPSIRAACGALSVAAALTAAGCTGPTPSAAAPAVTLDQVVVRSDEAGAAHERHILRFDVAESIAGEFFACAERKRKPRSIHIMDQFGNTILAARMDGQISDNVDAARMKAKTALYFRDNTGRWLNRSKADPLMAHWIAQLNQFTSPVGLPIVVEDQLLGTIGMGGASGDCAHEALTAVLGPQPPLEPPPEPQ
ncbi:MAG: heme-binding protein [Woeseia sp.]